MNSSVGKSKIVGRLLYVCSNRKETYTLRELITDEKKDLFLFTETWLTRDDGAVIQQLIPETHYSVQLQRYQRRCWRCDL